MAERQGFEPWKELPPCWFSRPVHSTALPSLHALYYATGLTFRKDQIALELDGLFNELFVSSIHKTLIINGCFHIKTDHHNYFKEIYNRFVHDTAREQSSRCSQCGVPFCQIHCPLHNNIPDWLKLTAEGRLLEAYELSQSTNNMPEVCGRICPQDRL